MVTYAQLRNMDFTKLSSAATAAGGLSGNLSSRGSEVASAADIPGGIWAGLDASAASALLAPLPMPLFDASDAFRHTQGVLETLVDSLTAAKGLLDDAHALTAGTGIEIGPDGTITIPETDSMSELDFKVEIARQVKRLIDEALRQADEADGLAAEDIKNQQPLQEVLPKPGDMRIPLGDGRSIPDPRFQNPLYQKLYEYSDVVDVWHEGGAKFTGQDGLVLSGKAGVGWKEGLLFGEKGEYGKITGILGAEAEGKFMIGPEGLHVGAGGFAGASAEIKSGPIDVGPGNTNLEMGVTPRFGIGAEADLGITYENGQLDVKPKLGVALGPGLSVAPEISIDVPATIDSLGDSVSSLREIVPGW